MDRVNSDKTVDEKSRENGRPSLYKFGEIKGNTGDRDRLATGRCGYSAKGLSYAPKVPRRVECGRTNCANMNSRQ